MCLVPGRAHGGFKMWFSKGVEKISDFYAEDNLMSYNQLCERYGIPR